MAARPRAFSAGGSLPAVSRRCVHRVSQQVVTAAHSDVSADKHDDDDISAIASRRAALTTMAVFLPAMACSVANAAEDFVKMEALKGKDYGKPRMTYKDYTLTDSGLQYQDLRVGDGAAPKDGATVIIDWSGYTVGYYGRVFEARNKPKGGAFLGDDKDYYRFRLGSGNSNVIAAVQEAVAGMRVGGIRRIIVPEELGYPDADYTNYGPQPTTFSGKRTLDFVLKNKGLIDKTLLMDIELIRVE